MMTNEDLEQDKVPTMIAGDLRDLARPEVRDDAFGQRLRQQLLKQAHHQTTIRTERSPRMSTTLPYPRAVAPRRAPRVRGRVAAFAAALLLALSGVAGYLRWQQPTPVSAQDLLRHVAAALQPAGPGHVVHDVSTTLTTSAPGISAGVSGLTAPNVTIDQWTQRAANGLITRQDITFSDPRGTVLQHKVQNGSILQLYDPIQHMTFVMTATQMSTEGQIIPDPFDTASLRQFVLDAQQGTNPDAHLLPGQTLDGVMVYVIQVVRTLPGISQANPETSPHKFTVTLYVNSGTYLIHELDISSANAQGHVLSSTVLRVVRQEVVPLSAVPAQIFTLRIPVHTQVIREP